MNPEVNSSSAVWSEGDHDYAHTRHSLMFANWHVDTQDINRK